MATTAALYTPQVLALATSLSAYPDEPELPLRGSARSLACGSALKLGLAIDTQGRIERVGLTTHACAIGQASAAVFAGAAIGKNRDDIQTALMQLQDWLVSAAELPSWPGLEAIAAARAFPARHGAILLSWRAAIDALSSAPRGG
ncbi:MAG: iron-sulfur cluster assembly scaffold protein [Proteobacteria bacterium]|nr:iron-sulfur cluster assembly scaffold protein [Pseudomonadota bacterium]